MPPNPRRQAISLMIGIGIIGLGIGWLAGMSLSPVIANIITAIVTAAAAIVAAVSGLEEKEAAQAESASEPTAVVDQPPENHTVSHQSRTTEAVTVASRLQVNPWPLAALLVGMFFGTSAGNWVRANDLFGQREPPETPLTAKVLQAEVEPWVTQGMSQTLVMQRLFDLKYPANGVASTSAATAGTSAETSGQPNPNITGLYALGTATGQAECQQIARTTNDELENLVLGKQNADGSRQPGLQNEVLQELFLALESPESFRDVVRILCASAQQ